MLFNLNSPHLFILGVEVLIRERERGIKSNLQELVIITSNNLCGNLQFYKKAPACNEREGGPKPGPEPS